MEGFRFIIGTLRGVRGRGVGDYSSFNEPSGIEAPYSPPYPTKGPYEFRAFGPQRVQRIPLGFLSGYDGVCCSRG